MRPAKGLLPEDFATIDADRDGFLSEAELVASIQRAADRLPNHAIPELNSVGAQEIFVTVAQGLCDFISAMDTATPASPMAMCRRGPSRGYSTRLAS